MKLLASRKENDCILLFDIGSGSVAGAIAFMRADEKPMILYQYRADIPYQGEVRGTRLLSLMLRTLAEVVKALLDEGFYNAGFGLHRPTIKEAFVSLSAPWIVPRTSFLSFRSETAVRITPEVVERLLRESAADSTPSRVPKGGALIEQKLIKSVLNGYETGAPFGKEASSAEFAVFGSFTLPKLTERVTEAIELHIHPRHASFHSFSLLSFAMLRDLYPAQDDFLFLDVSGEQTEVSIVKRGILAEAATFPFGRNTFIRTVARKAHVPASGVPAFFTLTRSASGTGALVEKVRKLLEAAKDEWVAHLSRALRSFSEELFVPRSAFLAADEDIAPLIGRAMETGDFRAVTVSEGGFRIIQLGNELLQPLVAWNPAATADPFIGLIAAAAGRLRR